MGATASADRVDEVGRDLGGDQVGRLGDLRRGAGVGEVVAELAQPDPGRAGQVGDGEVDVVRQGEVDVDLRAAVAGREGLADVVERGRPGRAPRCDEMTTSAAARASSQPGQRQGRAADPLGDAAGPVVVAVGDDDGAGPGPRGGGRRPARPCRRPRRRARRGRSSAPSSASARVEPGLHERAADEVDRGLGVHPLGDPQRLLQNRVQGGPDVAVHAGRGRASAAPGRGSAPRRRPSSRGPRPPRRRARCRAPRSARTGAAGARCGRPRRRSASAVVMAAECAVEGERTRRTPRCGCTSRARPPRSRARSAARRPRGRCGPPGRGRPTPGGTGGRRGATGRGRRGS